MRGSPFIDFDTGNVVLDPMALADRLPKVWTVEDKIEFFHCRVDVWQLGVAVEMVKLIEANKPPSIWSHAAYGVVSVIASYFEMVGKVLNPASQKSRTAGIDFNYGFCDVYRNTDICAAGPGSNYSDASVPHVVRFRDLMRNGMYHLGLPKRDFIIHNSEVFPSDFAIQIITDAVPVTALTEAYFMNPHKVTRTLVDHFGGFVDNLKVKSNTALRDNFVRVEDEFF